MTIRHSLTAAAGNTGPAPAPTDPQFNYVSLLLHGDGTNGAQNNTFLDSSTNNFTITRNGNTTQGSLSPYGNLWSNFFDGTGDYLTVAAATALDITSGDFTIEAWVLPGTQTNSVDSVFGYGFWTTMLYRNGSTWTWEVGNGSSSNYFTLSATCTQNVWQHIALTRVGNTYTFWLNGAAASTTTNTNGPATASRTLAIGVNSTASTTQSFTGYISNFRIVKGTAVYTSAFTPPTAPLTAISGTSLLTCQSNRFIDNSANNFTITRTGDVRVTKEAPFLPTAAYSTSVIGGSGYFDGAGDWLQIANNTALQVGSNNFCIECWICPTAMPAAGTVARFMTKNTGEPTGYEWTFGITPSGQLQFVFYTINTVAVTSSSGLIAANSCWYHVAFCRSGTTFGLFCNGVRQGGTVASRAILSTTSPVAIGRDLETTGREFTGYICDARIVNGSSVYNPSSGATLTVPTAPLTAITNTSLLLNFTNAGIFDNAAENDLETVGNAQISTSVKKYGTGSLAFDGTGGYLSVPMSQGFNFGSGDFTVEFWLYAASVNSVGVCAFPSNSSNYASVLVYGSGTTTLALYSSSAGSSWDVAGGVTMGTITTNSWNHVAVCRQGTSIRLFVNGVLGNTVTYSGSFTGTYTNSFIGDTPLNSPLNGYIDDVRITKGYARYTANFTPPTAAFPDQ